MTAESELRISELPALLGPALVREVRMPERSASGDPVVREIEIADASGLGDARAGALVCLVSAASIDPRRLVEMLADAAATGAAGIALKAEGDAEGPRVLAAVAEAGLAAVVLGESVSWREFEAVVSRLLGEQARSLRFSPSTTEQLFALANSIARVFRGSVAIENHQRGIIAHSSVPGQLLDDFRTSGILARQVLGEPVNEERYRAVLSAETIVRFPRHQDTLPRAAIAIRAGSIPLGTIWAIDPEGDDPDAHPLTVEKADVLVSSAELASDLLLAMWHEGNRSSGPREEAFRRVSIAAARPGDIALLDPSGDRLAIVVVGAVPQGAGSAASLAELHSALGRHLSNYLPGVVIIQEGNEVIAMCPTERIDPLRENIRTALQDLSHSSAAGAGIGMSDPHRIAVHMPYALAEARRIRQYTAVAVDPVVAFDSVRAQLFLTSCRAQLDLDDRLVLPEVRSLLDEGEKGRAFADTFVCWMDEACSVTAVAERMRLHEQTVRYRLRRVHERFGLDAKHPDRRLTIWLQLRLLRAPTG